MCGETSFGARIPGFETGGPTWPGHHDAVMGAIAALARTMLILIIAMASVVWPEPSIRHKATVR
jgi:hypothetical protein